MQLLELHGDIMANSLREALETWATPRRANVTLIELPPASSAPPERFAESVVNALADAKADLSVAWASSPGRHLLCLRPRSPAISATATTLAVDILDAVNGHGTAPPAAGHGSVRKGILEIDREASIWRRGTRLLFGGLDEPHTRRLLDSTANGPASIDAALERAVHCGVERSRDVEPSIAEAIRHGGQDYFAVAGCWSMPTPRPGVVHLVRYFHAASNHQGGPWLHVTWTVLGFELQCALAFVTPIIDELQARSIWAATHQALIESIELASPAPTLTLRR